MIRFDLEVERGGYRLAAQGETDARVGGLFGPSGSGKTTLLLALAGLLRPVRGRIEVGGATLYDSATDVHLPPERRRVAVVFQESRLFPHLTVAGNLNFSRTSRTSAGPEFHEVVDLLDLAPLLPRHPHQLSGGESKLVAVGRALLAKPRLLLLDEPLAGLDAARARKVLAYLLRLKETLEIRMLYVSHVFSDFLALVDEVAHLDEGRLAPFVPIAAWSPEQTAGGVLTTLRGVVVDVSANRVVVESAGTRFELDLPGAKVGERAFLTVDAQDVILSVEPPPPTSARNVLAGAIVEIKQGSRHQWVLIDAGPRIWAEITRSSGRDLALETGSRVHALVKASALRAVTFPSGDGRPSSR